MLQHDKPVVVQKMAETLKAFAMLEEKDGVARAADGSDSSTGSTKKHSVILSYSAPIV